MLSGLLGLFMEICFCGVFFLMISKMRLRKAKNNSTTEKAKSNVIIKTLSDEELAEEYFRRIQIKDYLNKEFKNGIESYKIVGPKFGSIRYTQGPILVQVFLKSGKVQYHSFHVVTMENGKPGILPQEEKKTFATVWLTENAASLIDAVEVAKSKKKVMVHYPVSDISEDEKKQIATEINENMGYLVAFKGDEMLLNIQTELNGNFNPASV